MNPKTHQQDEAFDKLCREIVQAAQANEAEIHAAANAPFLYQRLRAQIAATQNPITATAPPRSEKWNFVAAFGAIARLWHWERWAVVATAVAAAVWAGWLWQRPTALPSVAQPIASAIPAQSTESARATTAVSTELNQESTTQSKSAIANKIRAAKPVASKSVQVRASLDKVEDEIEEAEIATDFLPLTYTAHPDEQRGQIVRMEMPRSMLATLGVPLANVTGDRVKADVMLSDEGVALAIRFIQPQ